MFGASGIVRVTEAFAADVADTIVDQVWDVFARRHGIERSRPETWNRPFHKRSLDRVASSTLFDEIVTDRLATVVDAILGAGQWDWPAKWGDFLITFPNAPHWTLPTGGWHQDWSFSTDCDPPRFVKAFVFLNHVPAGAGGTLVVTGSHLLHGRYATGRVVEQGTVRKGSDRFYVECPYLRDLATPGDPDERRRRFLNAAATVDGVELQVVELTGEPGDVVFIHPWLVHAIAPNAGTGPRILRAPVFGRAAA